MRTKAVMLTLTLSIAISLVLMAQPVRIDLPEPVGEDFIGSSLFRSVSFVPLAVEKSAIITHDMELKVAQGQYFVLDNKFLQCVYRFDKDGRFLNTIGGEQRTTQQANQPQLVNPIKYSVDPIQRQVDVYNFENSEIRRYHFDGKRIDRIDININPADFIRERNGGYWFYAGWNNPETAFRLLRADRAGKIVGREKRLITKCTTTEGYSFHDSGKSISHWELLGNVTYRIVNNEVKEAFQFNYGTYALPLMFHQMDAQESFQLINKNGYYSIKKFMENDNFAYFFLNFTSPSLREMIHVIYDKKNKNPYILNELANIGAFDKAQALTDDDELIFFVSPRQIRRVFGRPGAEIPEVFAEVYEKIADVRFPVALSIKLGLPEGN